MPKLRWLTSVAGEFDREAGQITDETEETAATWADGERAERIERQQQPETTARQPSEAAVARVQRGRGR